MMCVRLGLYSKHTLAEVQGRDFRLQQSDWKRYVAWLIAEFSVIITDLPEVIGIGIACNLFFGWPYWIGVVCSFFTTLLFLAMANYGIRWMELVIVLMVGLMSVALFVEMGLLQPDVPQILEGWVSSCLVWFGLVWFLLLLLLLRTYRRISDIESKFRILVLLSCYCLCCYSYQIYGFIYTTPSDIFAITGIMGAVVMPHNLYLHSATIQERKIDRSHPTALDKAVKYCSWEPAFPIFVSFFINMAVVSIAAVSVYQQVSDEVANTVGLTNICTFFKHLGAAGCILWGIALLAAGQSSAITTTYVTSLLLFLLLK